jgi:hypothetical protein
MTDWLTWAADDPAPPEHAGYGDGRGGFVIAPEIDAALRRGCVVHSAEGWFRGTRPSDVMRALGNSWCVTVMQDGAVWRHRPRPTFADWASGGPAQNVGTFAVEMEGKDEPWTAAQRASLLRILAETWRWFGWTEVALGEHAFQTQHYVRQFLESRPKGSLWEHRWLASTTCPNGRNDWEWLVPALKQALAEEEEEVNLLVYNTASNPRAKYVLVPGFGFRPLRYEEDRALVARGVDTTPTTIGDDEFARIGAYSEERR